MNGNKKQGNGFESEKGHKNDQRGEQAPKKEGRSEERGNRQEQGRNAERSEKRSENGHTKSAKYNGQEEMSKRGLEDEEDVQHGPNCRRNS